MKLTFQILMERLGLYKVYERIISQYDKSKGFQPEHTLIKLCYRCIIAQRSIYKIEKILSMIHKQNQYLSTFITKINSSFAGKLTAFQI